MSETQLPPFDLHELRTFLAVAEAGSFTGGGERAGLTQSAVTRLIQSLEASMGTPLFERTTRSIALTDAGRYLRQRGQQILALANDSAQDFQQRFREGRPQLRVGLARTLGLAPLPGLFAAYRRECPEVGVEVRSGGSDELLGLLEQFELDVAVVCQRDRWPRALEAQTSFEDAFAVIVPDTGNRDDAQWPKRQLRGLGKASWLTIDSKTETGKQLQRWLGDHGLSIEPVMEVDNFDLIVNLVALGMGVSVVPRRVLPLYAHQRKVVRLPLRPVFKRQISLVVRKSAVQPDHVRAFVEHLLFS